MADSQPPTASPGPRRGLPPLDDPRDADDGTTAPFGDGTTGDGRFDAQAPSERHQDHSPDAEEAPPPPAGPTRPTRPPVVNEQAEVIERTRPGRIQLASERLWGIAVIFGALTFITAWIGHGGAVDALVTKVPEADPAAQREAAGILHYIALGTAAAGVLVEALLLALLRRRGIATRILLSLLALASLVLLPIALEILGPTNWLGVVVTVGLIAHAAGAVIGSVLMWLPIGRRRSA